jgi:hypothetical protein
VHLSRSLISLFPGNSYDPEYAAYLDSYRSCLLDYSHHPSPQAESALTLASLRLDEMQKGWRFPLLGNPLMIAIGNLFNRQNSHARIAEAAARSCVIGLSRPVVAAPPVVALEPYTDRAGVNLEPIDQSVPVPAGTGPIAREAYATPVDR